MKVPLFEPWILNDDKKAIVSAFKSSQLTDGPKLRKFEKSFATKVGSRYAIGVSSGTTALHLSLLSLGIGKDSEKSKLGELQLQNITIKN